jgi:hypothetical protein
MTRRAIPAPRKGHGRQGPDKDDDVRGTRKGRAAERIRQTQLKLNGIRDRGLKQQLRLGSKEKFYKALGQITGLEVAKKAVESTVRLQKMNAKTLWRSQPPPKRKKMLLPA